MTLPLIVGLFLLGGPPGISGFVVPGRIGISVNGMAQRGTFTNVGQKVFKRVLPPFTYANAALMVVLAFGIAAAAFHGNPTAIGRTAVVMMFGEHHITCASNFRLQASATADIASPEMNAVDDSGAAAITQTAIRSLSVLHRLETNDHQTPEPATGRCLLELPLLRHA